MSSSFPDSFVAGKAVMEFRLTAEAAGDPEAVLVRLRPTLERAFRVKYELLTRFKSATVETLILTSCDWDHQATLRLRPLQPCGHLLTVDLDFPCSSCPSPSYQDLLDATRAALSDLGDAAPDWQQMPLIKLGRKHNTYLTTSDDRLVEYGYTECPFDARSPFQHVQIFSTVDHGRVLVLDGLVNLAESDVRTYTHALMGINDHLSVDDYAGAEVLILGGGDGSLLKEVLDATKAAHVTMVDIDRVVTEACSEHMPSTCGDYLARGKGDRFEVVIGDAMAYMTAARKEGRAFDFVFGDLTDTPLDDDGEGEGGGGALGLVRRAADSALHLLRPNKGRYMTHCNGKSASRALEIFERMAAGLRSEERVAVKRWESFVSSFMEKWVFYELRNGGP